MEIGHVLDSLLSNDPTLTEIVILNKDLQLDALDRLCRGLATNSHVTSLVMRSNYCEDQYLGNVRTAMVVEALASNTSLTSLSLDCNGLSRTCAGVRALSSYLATNPSLRFLDISSNSCYPSGALEIGIALQTNSRLQTLDIGFNRLGDEGLGYICIALTSNHSLTHLDLTLNQASADSCGRLSTAIATNSTLQTLILSKNCLKSEGLLGVVSALQCESNPTSLSRLSRLEVSDCAISDDGSYRLSQVLPTNTTLTTLDISFNGIRSLKSIYRALRANSTLTNLSIQGNPELGAGIDTLIRVLDVNMTLLAVDVPGLSDRLDYLLDQRSGEFILK